jgi:hypothetical protein
LSFVGWELAGQRPGTGLEANGKYKFVPVLATSTICFTTLLPFEDAMCILVVYLGASRSEKCGDDANYHHLETVGCNHPFPGGSRDNDFGLPFRVQMKEIYEELKAEQKKSTKRAPPTN